ncbi:MAG: 2-oxo acid dehydrogenase subunit E2 [Vicinamibacteria bacterium]|nr:2-oxo acid dehydrogenase subunit E2 [Vicinamibacteria bacterium]
MIEDIKLPEISENIATAEVIRVLVGEGEIVAADQNIVEMETEKAIFEVPTTVKGKISKLLVKVGDTVKVGQVIAKIETGEEMRSAAPAAETKTVAEAAVARPEKSRLGEPRQTPPGEAVNGIKSIKEAQEKEESSAQESPEEDLKLVAPAAPSVRRLARELGVDIERVEGSGPGGRISHDDVKAFVSRRLAPEDSPVLLSADAGAWGDLHREPMSKTRIATARNMTASWSAVPQVTQFDEADVTEVERFRGRYGAKAEEAGGKLTVSVILLKICAQALKTFPRFNASLDMDKQEIVYKHAVHIGVAVDTEQGLLVPVVRDVDRKGLVALSRELSDLAERARQRRVRPNELEGGGFTISNLGGIGGTSFTPIVYAPQAAILGVARSQRRPVWNGTSFEPRIVLPLSLTYDHRLIDGADGARFMRWIREALESPLRLILESES